MPVDLLLGTNAVIALLELTPSAVQHIAFLRRQHLRAYISSLYIVLGELYYGAYHSARIQENVERVDRIAQGSVTLVFDPTTAKLYGQIEADLERRRQRIPTHDIWIAALAMQHGLTLLTADAHFERVQGLSLARW